MVECAWQVFLNYFSNVDLYFFRNVLIFLYFILVAIPFIYSLYYHYIILLSLKDYSFKNWFGSKLNYAHMLLLAHVWLTMDSLQHPVVQDARYQQTIPTYGLILGTLISWKSMSFSQLNHNEHGENVTQRGKLNFNGI